MKKINFKLLIVFFIGVIAMSAILIFSSYAKYYFLNSNRILYKLHDLQRLDNQLNYEVLSNSMYLYYNNDVISSTIHEIRKNIHQTEKIPFFRSHYPEAYREFMVFRDKFAQKENMIFEFLRFGFPLKNSLIYLTNSLNLMHLDKKSAQDILKILSNIFLAKNAIDTDFIKNINIKSVSYLKDSKDPFQRAFYKNLQIFLQYFPIFKKYLNEILNFPTGKILNKTNSLFMKRVTKDLQLFDILSWILAFFIAFLIFSISFAIIKLENYIKKLSHVLTHDILTGLANRYKFNQDVENKRNIAVTVFNIDKFKNINDYFGSQVGDKVLKKVAQSLKIFFEKYDIEVYRVGADDFAVIFEKWNEKDIVLIVKDAIESIEKQKIIINDTPFSISISAGIANMPPYLENADIALKKIKKNITEKIGIFDPSMNTEIKSNIEKTKEIQEALEENEIYPYFQPIFDRNGNVIKHEVLCRVKIGNEIRSIYPYLALLKEIRQYHKVTELILTHSYNLLEENSSVNLSINLSLEDIMNPNTYALIEKYFSNSDIGSRVTFEILESEISNYEIINDFIEKFKKYNLSFAIDDFGSGYSNFHRVLKMEVQYLKIDGSLIKEVDKDETSKSIVESIVMLAKKSGKKTVAEFVHSEEVYEMCKNIGVDCFQGFYLGAPSPHFY
jgi:diguanylate cyclase (GGDEF)-like protein